MSKIITQYVCPTCKETYKYKVRAEICYNQKTEQSFKVGDIVTIYGRFGWFDGDPLWVVNKPKGIIRNEVRPDSRMSFYYVVTSIKHNGHRYQYHVETMAMEGSQGYRSGYTYDSGHIKLKLADDVSNKVMKQSRKLIGNKAESLL